MEEARIADKIQAKCPVCGVFIDKGLVKFSAGPPGTRARLWARVCQFNDKAGCINRNERLIGPVKENDYYD